MKRTLIAFTAGAIIVGSLTFNIAGHTDKAEAQPVEKTIVLNEETILRNLTKSAELVTLTGEAEKTINYADKNWLGHRDVKLSTSGTFKLSVPTQGIEISTNGNVVTVRLPDPQISSLSLPYSKMDVREDKSLLRRELPDSDVKEMYKKAEKEIRKDIMNDKRAQEKAEQNAERVVEGIILKINGVQAVNFD